MESAKRILVVEDVASTREAYCRFLVHRGFEVVEAANLEEAREAIDKVAFHAACIDLGLDCDDFSNFDGQEVLRKINAEAEGTRTLIISEKRGGRAHDITISAYEDYKLDRFLQKGQFSSQEFIDAVTEQAQSAELAIFGAYESVFDALLHGHDAEIAQHEIFRRLNKGYSAVQRCIQTLTRPLVPIRPHCQTGTRFVLAEETVGFAFWSRSTGQAIDLQLSREAAALDDCRDVIKEVRSSKLYGRVAAAADTLRSSYL